MIRADQKSITIQNVLETITYAHELFNFIAIEKYPNWIYLVYPVDSITTVYTN
jgi:hypothetical protein